MADGSAREFDRPAPSPANPASLPRALSAPDRLYTIAEAGRLCRLTARAIRLYEERGLIAVPRDPQGARYYDESALERLSYIAFARRAGFTLQEIAELLSIERTGGLSALISATADKCRAQAAVLEARRRELEAVAAALSAPTACPPWRPRGGPRRQDAGASFPSLPC